MPEDESDREVGADTDEPGVSVGSDEGTDADDGDLPGQGDESASEGADVNRGADSVPGDDGNDGGDAFVFEHASDETTASRSPDEDASADTSTGDADAAPFSGLAERVEASTRTSTDGDAGGEADPDSDAAALFDRESVTEVDAERLWERLERDDSAPTSDVQERTIRQISKRAYCEGCEHFSDPPEVACSHEGTTILELTDLETFTVANCPVVREEEAIEDAT